MYAVPVDLAVRRISLRITAFAPSTTTRGVAGARGSSICAAPSSRKRSATSARVDRGRIHGVAVWPGRRQATADEGSRGAGGEEVPGAGREAEVPDARAIRTYRVSRVLELEVLVDSFEPPVGFELATYWQTYLARFDARRLRDTATA